MLGRTRIWLGRPFKDLVAAVSFLDFEAVTLGRSGRRLRTDGGREVIRSNTSQLDPRTCFNIL